MDGRRRGMDRRRRSTPLISRYTLVGRRRQERRRVEGSPFYYVDRIRTGLAVVLGVTFFFHILDAWLTLGHLSRGGTELNPLMDVLIQVHPAAFVLVKLALAGIGLLLLGLHQNFPYTRQAAGSLFLVFLGLVGYHLYLLTLS